MPKVLPRHINDKTGQVGGDEYFNVLNIAQQIEFWTAVSGSTTVGYTNSVPPTWGDSIIVFVGGAATLELNIRIPSDVTLGASGFIKVAADTGSITNFSAGVRCYADDLTFLGERRFLLNNAAIGTGDTTINEFIFDVGGAADQFPAETSFVKPMISWTAVSSLIMLKTFLIRPLDNARKALYV